MHHFKQVLVAGMISIMPPVVSQVHAAQPTKSEDKINSSSVTITKDATKAGAYLCVIEISDLSTGKSAKNQLPALRGKPVGLDTTDGPNSANFDILVSEDGSKASIKITNMKNGKITSVYTMSISI
jgi:hypothetical protein